MKASLLIFLCACVAGEALCLPTLLFHRRWWSVRDSWSGNQPNCHPVTPQETLCRSVLFYSLFLMRVFFSLTSYFALFSSPLYLVFFVSEHILLDGEGSLCVYYLCRHPQCCVWWAVPAHRCHVFFGGRDSATQKPCTHLQPCGGKAVVLYIRFACCVHLFRCV